MRVVDYVIDEVYKAGAKHAFTITGGGAMSVSYTHLTLPTSDLV